MILTKLAIENFKAIGPRQEIELKPITLLFGPNSAGKSTILQALHYLREILERGNTDPDTTIAGGTLNLGGFRNLVHGRDTRRPIVIRADLDLGGEPLPSYVKISEREWEEFGDSQLEEFSESIQNAAVEFEIRWHEGLERAYVSRHATWLNGSYLGGIVASLDGGILEIPDLRLRHPLLHPIHLAYSESDELGKQVEVIPSTFEDMLSTFVYADRMTSAGQPLILLEGSRDGSALMSLDDELPVKFERFPYDDADGEWDDIDDDALEKGASQVRLLRQILSQAFLGPTAVLRDSLKSMCYLGPIRDLPSRNFDPTRSPDEGRWASGIAAWDLLHANPHDLADSASDWLSGANRLNSGYALHVHRYKEISTDSPIVFALNDALELEHLEWIQQELRQLPEKVRISLYDIKKDIDVWPEDVGVGVSQLLPVVVAALHAQSGIVAIEQPELHVHPALQAALGDLFASAIEAHRRDAVSDRDLVFLLETHSEHLMLRLQRRIREAYNQELPQDAPHLSAGDLSVVYVEPTDQGARLNQIRVDDEGDWLDVWPQGFFAERRRELM